MDFSEPEFKYPYNPTDGRENLDASNDTLRVLRGGAYWGYQGGARCAYRDRYDPDARFDDSGFRVVVLP